MSYMIPPAALAPVLHLDDYRTALPPEAPADDTAVWGEVAAAASLFGKLREAGLSVRFDVDDPTQPPRVQITDLQGHAIREVPASVACDPYALEREALRPAG